MKKIETSTLDNILKKIHSRLIEIPNEFRDKVELECNWSAPTYYRKMKADNSAAQLSNAEREKIIALLGENLAELQSYYNNISNDKTINPA